MSKARKAIRSSCRCSEQNVGDVMSAQNQDQAIFGKISRLGAGARPRVLDLFSGCGGISLGFDVAGYEISAALELDPLAAQSHALNFHPNDVRHAKAYDITSTAPKALCRELGLGLVGESIDVIVGGPPCQAFARVGRAKLREVDEHPEAFLYDPRAQLYKSYLDYVKAFKPLAILMENVPDILNHGGQNIAEEVCDVLERKGYVCSYTLLNSVFYGVPQMRERMFLIAYRKELGIDNPSFPNPTHCHELPSGYEGSRAVALKLLNGLFSGAHDYLEPPGANGRTKPAVTAFEAIGDLPFIDARKELSEGHLKRGTRRFDVPTMQYDGKRAISDYARMMKEWPGFPAPKSGLHDHQIRFLPRDYELFAEMREGAEYPELHALAIRRFENKAHTLGLAPNSTAWKQLKADMVPPYDPGKFPNKWWKLRRDWPVRTLMAHLGKDSYSHIHYDSKQARTISVREAARLQSFPDGFRFCGTMNPAFRQIGNAVPPLLARAVAIEMLVTLQAAIRKIGAVAFAASEAAE
ncbi:DNA (Cytosine-5-)-methyltransferase [Rhodospirillaceae bacterium LM-1]|nr:DNA (Cytosine-5-)-methyltransferase [Rhodospirillaceae bacterium LM-1]